MKSRRRRRSACSIAPGHPARERRARCARSSADERDAYRQARNAYAAQVHARQRPRAEPRPARLRRRAAARDAGLGGRGLDGGRPRAAPDQPHHRHRALDLRPHARRAHRARRAARRAARAGRHLRLDARAASRPPSRASGASWPTRRTSCARRWRSCAPSSTSPSTIPTPIATSCARWPSSCATPTSAWSGSSPRLLALASSEAGIVPGARGRPGRDRGARRSTARSAFAAGGALQLDAAARRPRRSSAIRCCSSAWPRTSSRTRSATTPPSAGCACAPGSSAARRSCTSPTRARASTRRAVEELLEPFRRLESSRARSTGGYGLGLAVVRAVAQAHGGRVAVLARREGGLEVTVSLPMASAAAGEPIVARPRGR